MWKVIKCAVQGISHLDKGIPCQDKVYNLAKNGVTTIALADGAGSAIFSHYGAELITRHICEKLCQNFDSIFNNDDGINAKKNLVNDILEQLELLAVDKRCQLNDLASTLLFVSVQDNRFILAHIGDGTIGYLKDNELKTVEMKKKEGAVNETFFTTSSNVLQQMQLIKGSLDTISGFVLMSDGTEASFYDKRKNLIADIVKKLMLMCDTHRCEVLEKVLLSSFESVIKHQTADDCSIVFMYNGIDAISSWKNLSTDQLISLLGLSLSQKSCYKDFKVCYNILNLLTKKTCSCNMMYRMFHIKRKEKKDFFNRQLQRLQKMQLIAEIKEGVYSLFVN